MADHAGGLAFAIASGNEAAQEEELLTAKAKRRGRSIKRAKEMMRSDGSRSALFH
eukprot:SAG22_NODE_13054_length_420_cov_1.121495_2_plen_54_part_01